MDEHVKQTPKGVVLRVIQDKQLSQSLNLLCEELLSAMRIADLSERQVRNNPQLNALFSPETCAILAPMLSKRNGVLLVQKWLSFKPFDN